MHPCRQDRSSVLVKTILHYFILDLGYPLPAGINLTHDTFTDENKSLFREEIVQHVTTLIGRKPRLQQDEGDGNFSIFYE